MTYPFAADLRVFGPSVSGRQHPLNIYCVYAVEKLLLTVTRQPV